MENLQKFQDLLKKLFQFESADLDFGIYRILNYKRDRIEKFIDEDLKNTVESAFAKHKDERLSGINQSFEETKQKIIQNFGENAFIPTGDLKEEFKITPLGKDFLSIKEQKEEAQTIDEIKLQVFNDLYNFFSRYYEEGDFTPQYRYSIKGHRYAIPYNGEEVKLYYANYDQYYTKTGLLFRDYTFKANNHRVIFRVVSAKEEVGSKKATKERFFMLDDENPIEITENKNLVIRFQYRELTEEEIKNYQVEGGSNTSKQEKINQKIYDDILKKIEDMELKMQLDKEYKNEKSLLLYQLSRFTAKNTRDYFIHKNLKKFLSEQLDYFIKAEVLDIETIEKERFLDKHITRAKVVREVGEKIIDFLSQIEDFQKRLWEKKKFVLKTEYVITIDKIKEYAGEEFLNSITNEILKNENQLEEWEMLGFGKIEKEEDLFFKKDLIDAEYRKLPIDTKYFSQDFKERLIEKLTENADLDDLLDGLLIKSENWQALNLLLGKYKEKVQTIYIDPPFNKEQDADYLYNVKYKDSTWASTLENRLRLARDILDEKGSIFVRCDYNGNWIVRPLMDEIFGRENFRNELTLRKVNYQGTNIPERFNPAYDLLYFYSNGERIVFRRVFKERNREIRWVNAISPKENKEANVIVINGRKFTAPQNNHWRFSQEKFDALNSEGRIRINEEYDYIDVFGKKQKGMPQYLESQLTPLDSNWTDISGYSFGWNFPTENSEILLKRIIESTSNEGDLVMDFFLGSGTTTAVAQKLGRKWIGIEMGEHFWSVIMPRMKRVLAYDKSGISKENDVKERYNENNAGGFFKYQILEQYEDTLDNIELTENKQVELKLGDDYLLKYFLDFETRESPYLLNMDHLKNPFSYKLKVNLEEVGEPQEMIVDIPETFNYLLGLKIKKIKVRNNQRKYLFILGEKEGKDIAIVWREYKENWDEDDFKKDKEFIIQELKPWRPHIVYVNGQSVLTSKLGDNIVEIRYIEPEFKRLMG
ncbi:MAG TPA: DNA methyltransferase [Dictyoglomaceae bacterium]|nr:DNA methyltransferase [Dictyoglomaceae bacterium]HOL39780.1 DNA methyltransferase [Dictyoglomaceae bacterium]HOP95191.1 DNA methyltransferase [Dictyoglomaceae bacterium]HPP16240.1 DNA methyltransferase [Dictyoglomaceae bacterium]HPU44087.1 DNA methyltransferase [Dictyoglomaceae bacterium]